jgi:hypothetical protein
MQVPLTARPKETFLEMNSGTRVQCHQVEESCIIDGLAPCKIIDQREKQPNRADGNAGARGIGS